MKMTKIMIQLVSAAVFATAGWAQTTYVNEFTSDSFPQFVPGGTEGAWTLDTENESLNFNLTGPNNTRVAGIDLAGWDAANFSVSTDFRLNSFDDTVWMGMLALGSGAFNDGYLADYDFSGELRLFRLDGGSPVASDLDDTVGALEAGNEYRLQLDGVYDETGLTLTFSAYDITETVDLLGTVSLTDADPRSDQFFGLRNRVNPGSLDVDYNNFAVVPEPSVAALLTGLVVLGGLLFRRAFPFGRRRESTD